MGMAKQRIAALCAPTTNLLNILDPPLRKDSLVVKGNKESEYRNLKRQVLEYLSSTNSRGRREVSIVNTTFPKIITFSTITLYKETYT